MARIVKNKDPWHALTVRTDRNDGEVIIVGNRKRCYLWAGRYCGDSGCVTVSGTVALRKLANAILKNVGQR